MSLYVIGRAHCFALFVNTNVMSMEHLKCKDKMKRERYAHDDELDQLPLVNTINLLSVWLRS